MSEEKPPALAMKEALERIEDVLLDMGKAARDSATQHKTSGEELATLLGDCRDTITEAVGVMHSQTSDLLQMMDVVQQQMGSRAEATPPTQARPWRLLLAATGVGIVVASLGAWALWPDTRYWQLALGVDGVLTQQYPGLGKPLQEQLNAVYAGAGIQTPGKRQKGSK
jgi:hypothetical protein